jgi:hypothetical protein
VLKYITILIFCFSCTTQKYANQRAENISNFIICHFLNEYPFPEKKLSGIRIYYGFKRELKDPPSFFKKYQCCSTETDFNSIIKPINIYQSEKCNKNNNVLFLAYDYDYNYFSESETTYRISDIYFTSKNRGCFIASNICGVDCEEANIYSFEFIKPDKYLFKLVCPYFVT